MINFSQILIFINICSAARNIETLKELYYDELIQISSLLNIKVVETHNIKNNIDDITKTLQNMPFSEEGYVVVDKFFRRIKIKNPAYIAVHYLKGKTSTHHIIYIIKSNEIDEFISIFIERKDEILFLKNRYDELIENLKKVWNILELCDNITSEDKKIFASEVFNNCDIYNCKNFSGLFFALKNGKCESIMDFVINYDNKKLYDILKLS